MVYINADLADDILARADLTTSLAIESINETSRPLVSDLPGLITRGDVHHSSGVEVQTENVVAMIEGRDPVLKNEFVVISSHYDHIGMDLASEGDQVYNGADDDGSGTIAILEIAEAFVQAARDGFGPRRSLLFLNVTGEE